MRRDCLYSPPCSNMDGCECRSFTGGNVRGIVALGLMAIAVGFVAYIVTIM